MDPILSVGMGREACRTMQTNGYAVEWREYPMGHEVCAEELLEIRRWLLRQLAESGPTQ
jgi:phospholipase/carboxylesterase